MKISLISILGVVLCTTLLIKYRKVKPAKPVSSIHILIRIFSWVFYIFAYELFFRGFLLFDLAEKYGLIMSIIINVILYAGIHSVKEESEFLWSIPFGVFLCITAVWTGSFIPVFIIHMSLSVTALMQEYRVIPAKNLQ